MFPTVAVLQGILLKHLCRAFDLFGLFKRIVGLYIAASPQCSVWELLLAFVLTLPISSYFSNSAMLEISLYVQQRTAGYAAADDGDLEVVVIMHAGSLY